jgi:hypothetical protein
MPIGPPLFDGEYELAPEDGSPSDAWVLTTNDEATMPASIGPQDKVNDPDGHAKAAALLFPSVVGTDGVTIAWEQVPHATAYDVDYYPVLGNAYAPDQLQILTGQNPWWVDSVWLPTVSSEEWNFSTWNLIVDEDSPDLLYGYWYTIIAYGPDGTHSPLPPWVATTSTSLFEGDENFGSPEFPVPHEYARLVDQPRPRNTGVALLRPDPIEIANITVLDEAWIDGEFQAPAIKVSAVPADGGTDLWTPWGDYQVVVYDGPGCDPSATIATYGEGSLDPLIATVFFDAIATSPSISLRARASYDDAAADPAQLWQGTGFELLPEAEWFVKQSRSSCHDLELPEPPPPPEPTIYQCGQPVTPELGVTEYTVDLGGEAYGVDFGYTTGSKADTITVSSGSQTLFGTGCIATEVDIPADPFWQACAAEQSNGVFCYFGGLLMWANGWVDSDGLYPPEGATQVTVTIAQCEVGAGVAEWEFVVGCP